MHVMVTIVRQEGHWARSFSGQRVSAKTLVTSFVVVVGVPFSTFTLWDNSVGSAQYLESRPASR